MLMIVLCKLEAQPYLTELESFGHKFQAETFNWKLVRGYGLLNHCLAPPKVGMATCGKVLSHAKQQVTSFRETMGVQLCVFKVGVTANPILRFVSYLELGFSTMWLIASSHSIDLIHMLEAALISEFQQGTGCKNKPGSGGEGALNRAKPAEPPYYAYVVGGRADQRGWVG